MQPNANVEWDADTYHRVAEPQVEWARRVLDGIPLGGSERVIDAGCGTGRLTAEVLSRVPAGRVLAVDYSENMLRVARQHLLPRFGTRVSLLRSDLSALSVRSWADLVFSTATFHWIHDHDRLFRSLYAALKPGGRLVAQCGGRGNLSALHHRADRLMAAPQYARHFDSWRDPWQFADVPTSKARLSAAGFVDVEATLEPAPVRFDDAQAYGEFLRSVIVRVHLEHLPEDRRRHFVADLSAQATRDEPPFLLDYWRLNLRATRPVNSGT